jgi:uncharacterized protein YtpQ (UPF0354 family)
MTPFDYVNEILHTKKQLIVDEITEKEYIPFIVNRSLSYHKDCIMQANEMNRRNFIDKKLQNDFLINTIRGYKRPFVKWSKSDKKDDVEYIKLFYNISTSKAYDALKLLSKEQLQLIKERTDTGGT